MSFSAYKGWAIPDGNVVRVVDALGNVLWERVKQYVKNGLIMWCDGIDNTGNGHDSTVTTWKDLTGNGNDTINTTTKTATTPAATVQGEWKNNGIFIRAAAHDPSQRIRTVKEFDLGADRTLEVRFTIVEDMYAAFGFATGDRYKYRIINSTTGNPTNDWARYSASDTVDVITHGLSKSAIVGVPSTMAITRHYDAEADTTTYTVYLDGVQVGTKSFSGNHRAGETSHILLGNERDVAIYHSVRLYNRALTAEEIVENYEYDKLRFAPIQDYINSGLRAWCDGIDNTGSGHDDTVTTWRDLTGNGYDLINVASKSAVVAADTVQGEWTDNGITINALSNQFLRTVQEFDLGKDRTLEMRLTIVSDQYAESGLVKAERYKYRLTGINGWYILSEADSGSFVLSGKNIPSTAIGEQFTVSITRAYDTASDTTIYDVYYNGVFKNQTTVAGDYRVGDTSILLFGDERDHITVHSVRLYGRALSGGEIADNYAYDELRFAAASE